MNGEDRLFEIIDQYLTPTLHRDRGKRAEVELGHSGRDTGESLACRDEDVRFGDSDPFSGEVDVDRRQALPHPHGVGGAI